MAIEHDLITVDTSATALSALLAGDDDRARTYVFTNEGAVDVFLGGPGVTSSDYGYLLAAGGEVALDLQGSDILYGVTAASTADVRALVLGGY